MHYECYNVPRFNTSTRTSRSRRRTRAHPLQYLDQVRIQSVLSAADLLHVPLELLDQNLQLADTLVCFVGSTDQRPGLDKTGTQTLTTHAHTHTEAKRNPSQCITL